MSINSKSFLSAIVSSLLWSSLLWAHSGKSHEGIHNEKKTIEQDSKIFFEKINSDYIKTVRPIFETKCFACHTQGMTVPWYSKLPLIKGMIEYDTTEAKKHLDMTNDYPFKGHGGPEEDLEAIRETLVKGEMPPLRYRMVHWSSSLNTKEIQTVQEWIERAKKEFNSNVFICAFVARFL